MTVQYAAEQFFGIKGVFWSCLNGKYGSSYTEKKGEKHLMGRYSRVLELRLQYLLAVLILSLTFACQQSTEILGDLKKWHRIELIFEGPETMELAEDNPFLNYRLDVTFSNGNRTYKVPGFFAADGNAAETSATSGDKWKVRFTPDKAGEWEYTVHF